MTAAYNGIGFTLALLLIHNEAPPQMVFDILLQLRQLLQLLQPHYGLSLDEQALQTIQLLDDEYFDGLDLIVPLYNKLLKLHLLNPSLLLCQFVPQSLYLLLESL